MVVCHVTSFSVGFYTYLYHARDDFILKANMLGRIIVEQILARKFESSKSHENQIEDKCIGVFWIDAFETPRETHVSYNSKEFM